MSFGIFIISRYTKLKFYVTNLVLLFIVKQISSRILNFFQMIYKLKIKIKSYSRQIRVHYEKRE